jgi:hypothetical protein
MYVETDCEAIKQHTSISGGRRRFRQRLRVEFNFALAEEWRLLGYKNPVRTSQETYYVSATEFSQLMLCKISGLHGGDYEEWSLLGYKNPVRTSKETYYVSATEFSQLMLCKI